MLQPLRPKLLYLLVALALTRVLSFDAGAEPLKLDGGSATVGGTWRFHLGDDTAWAAKDFDDSNWEELTVDRPWGMQGHPNRAGFGWYRQRVTLQPGTAMPDDLWILLPAIEDAYEIYWNGILVGKLGAFPPHGMWYQNLQPRVFTLGSATSGVLAVRVWSAPFGSLDSGKQGGFYAPPLIGSEKAIHSALAGLDFEWLRSHQLEYALNSLYGLVALLSLIGWLRNRTQWPILWMACFAACKALFPIFFSSRLPLPETLAIGLSGVFYCLSDVALWYLLLWLLDLRDNTRLMRTARFLAVLDLGQAVLDMLALSAFAHENPVPAQAADAVFTAIMVLVDVFPFVIIGVAVARRKHLDLQRWIVAAIAFMTQMIFVCGIALAQGSRFTHWTIADAINSPVFAVWGNPVNAATLSSLLLLAAMVIAVYRQSDERNRRQSVLEREFRHARTVQQVLVPEAIPPVPGFSINSVYKPAGEVGGDFFQILPTEGDGVLVIIGDVSGKGMSAAMTVSLLVGTVRTLAHYTQRPAEILSAMNQRMVSRSRGGFTTCLVMKAEADGLVTLANAGHIAPYLVGAEVPVEGSLPLGLSPDTVYAESTFVLAEDMQLTLVTDGVVEARDRNGALFGFERTSAISVQSATSIAYAAQQFGQEDDITVVTVTRKPVTQPTQPVPFSSTS